MNNFLLKFPIKLINNFPLSLSKNINSIIYIHLHTIIELTHKINNFLFNMLNYKIKLYNLIITNSSNRICLLNKSNKKIRIQKSSGKSRLGSLKSSMFRGGGVMFGPYPGRINFKINTKEWNNVYKSILFNRRSNISWFYIKKMYLNYNVTRLYDKILCNLGISKKDKVLFFIISKYMYYKNIDNINYICYFRNISILKFLITKYLIYFL